MLEKFLIYFGKLSRYAAWVLLVVFITFFITGYGMTKGLVERDFATSLHLHWLAPIGLVAFLFHAAWSVYLALRRWQWWNLASKIFLVSIGLFLLVGFVYVNYFFKNSNNYPTKPTVNSSVFPIITTSTGRVFTALELSKYNGQNGQPAYAAIDGVVYDLSSVFRRGDHHGYTAGQDLSSAFHDQHEAQILQRFSVVGTYSK